MSLVDVYMRKYFQGIYPAFKVYFDFVCMLVSQYEYPMSAYLFSFLFNADAEDSQDRKDTKTTIYGCFTSH